MIEDFELISIPKELLETLVCRVLAEYIRATDPNVKETSQVEALEFRREQYGLTQAVWASVLNIQPSHYSEIINGKRSLPMKAAARAFRFGVPAEALFQCEQDKGFGDIGGEE